LRGFDSRRLHSPLEVRLRLRRTHDFERINYRYRRAVAADAGNAGIGCESRSSNLDVPTATARRFAMELSDYRASGRAS
jgi:hypothetical protein